MLFSFISKQNGFSYVIDFYQFIWDYLPIRLKKPKLFKYIISAIIEIKNFNQYFLLYRDNTLELVTVNCQKIILEKYLRKRFNNLNINILNTYPKEDFVYLNRQSEVQDLDEYNTYLYKNGETPLTPQIYTYNKQELIKDYDFIVEIPSSVLLIFNEQSIKNVIDSYKVIGMRYKLEII